MIRQYLQLLLQDVKLYATFVIFGDVRDTLKTVQDKFFVVCLHFKALNKVTTDPKFYAL